MNKKFKLCLSIKILYIKINNKLIIILIKLIKEIYYKCRLKISI